MVDETIIQQELEYKKEKQELSDIIKKFNKYYRLIEDFCEPFVEDEDKLERKQRIKSIIKGFSSLEEFYKNPEEFIKIKFSEEYHNELQKREQHLPLGGLYGQEISKWEARISEKDPRSIFQSKELNRCGYNTVALWTLAKKASRYNGVINFFYVDAGNLQGADSCRLKDIEANKQGILPLGEGYDYKEDMYLSKVEDIKKLQEELMEKLTLLEQASWRDAILFWFRNCELKEIVKEIGGSTNFVIEIGDDFMYAPSSFIIKTSEKGSSSLKFEKEIIEYLRKDFRTQMKDFLSLASEYTGYYGCGFCNSVVLPKIFCFFESQNLEILAMYKDEYGVEMTKSKLDDKQREECLETIADFLASIHKRTPLSISKKGIIDISDYIHKRLDNPFFELKDSTKLKLSKNLTPVLECLVNAPCGIYKDAHPDNFLVNSHPTITVLDWEDKGFHPIYFDLVNFCEYSDFVTLEEKKMLLERYIEVYNHNVSEGEPELEYGSDFHLSYLNAVIYRSICFSSAWSNPNRGGCKQRRKNMLNKAVGAINTIKNDHTSYYHKYKDNYDLLGEAIKEAITQLP